MAVQTFTKYESNSGSIHKIRLNPGTVTPAGSPPAGAIDSNIPAKVSKSNGEFGVRPRGVSLSRVIGTGDAASRKYRFLPILTPTAWDAIDVGDDVTISAVTWEVVAKVNEDL